VFMEVRAGRPGPVNVVLATVSSMLIQPAQKPSPLASAVMVNDWARTARTTNNRTGTTTRVTQGSGGGGRR